MSRSPETVILTLGPAQKLTLDLGQGAVNARKVSDNKIQLKFRTKDFEGEYFHYTGDLFLIYKSGHLMKLMCLIRRPELLPFSTSNFSQPLDSDHVAKSLPFASRPRVKFGTCSFKSQARRRSREHPGERRHSAGRAAGHRH